MMIINRFYLGIIFFSYVITVCSIKRSSHTTIFKLFRDDIRGGSSDLNNNRNSSAIDINGSEAVEYGFNESIYKVDLKSTDKKGKKKKRKTLKKNKKKASTETFSSDSDEQSESTDYERTRTFENEPSLFFSVVDDVQGTLRSIATFGGSIVKSAIKTTVDFACNKQVSLDQILGKWRLHQEIRLPRGNSLSYPVAIELLKNGTIISSFDDEEFRSEFEFKERPWPKKCTISFRIPSVRLDVVDDNEEVMSSEEKASSGSGLLRPDTVLLYKGSFKVSLLNRKVVLMRGAVYKAVKKRL
mmetsp:Transcript_31514/g.45369  ORF Transcript_31514/g.45369 Transcript_31514/m.45369 type:complete len:299 (+) Transcript_31514:1241-2137(+)